MRRFLDRSKLYNVALEAEEMPPTDAPKVKPVPEEPPAEPTPPEDDKTGDAGEKTPEATPAEGEPPAEPVEPIVPSEDNKDKGDADNLQADLMELNESSDEGEEQTDDIDEAVDTTEALESYVTKVDSFVKTGGLTKEGADLLRMGLSQQYKRVEKLGFKQPESLSLEAFGGPVTRVRATSIALEDIKEQLKLIWEKIIKAIKDAYEWITSHFMKIFGAAERMEKNAKALVEAAGKLNGAPHTAEIEDAKLFNALRLNGKVDHTLISHLQALDKDNLSLNESLSKTVKEIVDALAKAMSNPADSTIKLPVAKPNGFSSVSNPEAEGFKDLPGGMGVVQSPVLLGDVVVFMKVVAETDDRADVHKLFDHGLNQVTMQSVGNEIPTAKMKTLKPEEIKQLALTCESVAKHLLEQKKTISEFQTDAKKAISEAEKGLSSAASANNAKPSDESRKTFKALYNSLKSSAVLPTYTLRTAGAALSFASASFKQYGEKKPEANATATPTPAAA